MLGLVAIASLDGVVGVPHVAVNPGVANVRRLKEPLEGVPALVELEVARLQTRLLVSALGAITDAAVAERLRRSATEREPALAFDAE